VSGVREVAATSHLPLSGSENAAYFFVEGAAEPAPGQEPLAERRVVTPGYLGAMRVTILKGRDFDMSDEPGKPPVILVSETSARKFFPGGNAIGKRIRLKDSAPGEWLSIVGVSRDVRGSALETQPRPAIYRPLAQDRGIMTS
jgi:putative ABC transport system permease protein